MRGEAATAAVRGRLKNRDEVVPEAEPPVPFTRPHSTARRPATTRAWSWGSSARSWPSASCSRCGSSAGSAPRAARASRPPPRRRRHPPPRPLVAGTGHGEPTTSAPAASPAVLPVAAVSALDPQGGGENSQTAARAVDGDPSTAWESQRYNSAAFGGLKDGMGLLLDLGAEVQVSSVALTDGGEGGSVSLLTAPGPALDGSQPVATAPAGGQQTLTPAQPVRSRWLVVWFTQLPTTDGVFRASVAEIAVTGTPAS